ncbi:MAG: hypothetical protein JNM39_13620 [Bdellovibrionaceae bacterium]|nr:hypothetical protein [Pseudobdellovibrionaceae bacterium]
MNQATTLSGLKDMNLVTHVKNPPWNIELMNKFWAGIRKLKELWQWILSLWIWRMISSLAGGLFNLLFAAPPGQERIEQIRVKAMQYRSVF